MSKENQPEKKPEDKNRREQEIAKIAFEIWQAFGDPNPKANWGRAEKVWEKRNELPPEAFIGS